MATRECTHTDHIRGVTPSGQGCEECLRAGDSWVELRLCLTCGHVGCCDTSPGRHAMQHAQEADHPIVESFQPGQSWRWCYLDRVYL